MRGGGHGGAASGLSQTLVPNPLRTSGLENPWESSMGCGGMEGVKPPYLNWGTVVTAWLWPGRPLSGSQAEGSSSALEAVTPPSQPWS